MAKLMPYINFQGKTAEALTFYHSVLGGDLNIQKIGDSPMKDHMPPEMHNKVMHASLTAPGILIGASDMSEGVLEMGRAFSLCLDCASEEEMHKLWNGLLQGGKANHEISSTHWGSFGDLTDKYGVDWMFSYSTPRAKE